METSSIQVLRSTDGQDLILKRQHRISHSMLPSFTVPNPTKISITFTLTNVKFRDTGSKDVDATEITGDQDDVSMILGGEDKELSVNVAPVETTSKVTFVSSDDSVVDVDNTAVSPVDGIATAKP